MAGDYEEYGPTVLRVVLGLLFLVPGLGKLMNPGMIAGMLSGMGFPAATLFGWLVILAEVLGGAALIVGWRTKYAVWPLVVVLLVALFAVHIKAIADPMGQVTILFHLLGLAGLVSVYLTGPGTMAMDK